MLFIAPFCSQLNPLAIIASLTKEANTSSLQSQNYQEAQAYLEYTRQTYHPTLSTIGTGVVGRIWLEIW
jgi:hypothetical protein